MQRGEDLLSQTYHNRHSLGGASRYRGVLWDAPSQSWRAKIKVKSRTWYLGVYREELLAGKAYDCAAAFVLGRKAILNFPQVNYDFSEPPRVPPPWIFESIRKRCAETSESLPSAFSLYLLNHPNAEWNPDRFVFPLKSPAGEFRVVCAKAPHKSW